MPSTRRQLLRRSRALLLAVLLAGPAAMTTGALAQDGSNDVQIQITECGDGSASSDCSGGPTQVVEAAPPQQQATVSVPQGSSNPAPGKPEPPANEVQTFDLQTGQGTVVSGDTSQAATIAVDKSVTEAQRPDAREPAAAPVLPDVQTGGGSPFAGYGAGFSFVSADEALARFAIPPFLQPIYQAAGRAYGVPWNVLAAINSIETDFGRIENQVSSAGALGWMQFMPGTWKLYGVDATGDGVADPWNPVDAIYAAARYLRAAGAATDVRRAILAYNHADWYADSVLKTASIYGSLPSGLVAETGSLAFGQFPLRGRVSYGDDFRKAEAAGATPRGLRISGADGARAITTQGVTVKQILLDPELADVLERQKVLRSRGLTTTRSVRTAPTATAASAASESVLVLSELPLSTVGSLLDGLTRPVAAAAPVAAVAPELPATPALDVLGAQASRTEGKAPDGAGLPAGFGRTRAPGLTVVVTDALDNTYRYEGLVKLRSGLRPGAHLDGGQTIGYVGSGDRASFVFALRAAGGAPVDPRPLVDGYRLQEAAGFQHVAASLGENPFMPSTESVAAGSVSGTDRQLARRVLDDSGISIYPCGRQDIEHGDIDRRVLGALLYLRKAGMTLTISSLHCGHGYYTASGNVSAHSYGAAVDIAAFNGQPVLGHQGPGTLIEHAIKLLMQLKGNAAPSQLISLMTLGGPSFALADHADHLHVGYAFQQSLGLGRTGDALGSVTFQAGSGVLGLPVAGDGDAHGAKADEAKLSTRLGKIRNPKVRSTHGPGSLKVGEAEAAHDVARAERIEARRTPLRTQPTAAGAEIIDADVARDGGAYAIGFVDGSQRPGWADRQVVALAQRHGAWVLVGPPRDATGKVVNPRLRALAALPGGRGYAVGARGAVVALHGNAAPTVLAPVTHSDLSAVDARVVHDRPLAFAAGADGRVLRLRGDRAEAERSGNDALHAILVRADGSVTAVSSPSGQGPVLHRRSNGSWTTSTADLALPDGASVRFTALADDPAGLWAAGGITYSAATGPGVVAPLVAQYSNGRWTTWCAGSPALTAVRELGNQTPRACDSTLLIDPVTLGAAGDITSTSDGVVVATPAGVSIHTPRGFRAVPDLTAGAGPSGDSYSRLALADDGSGWAIGSHGAMARVLRAAAAPSAPVQRLTSAGAANDLSLTVSGDHVLAVADGAAIPIGRDAPPADSGLRLRSVAWASDHTAWGLEENTGALVRYADGKWSAAASAMGAGQLDFQKVLEAMGAGKLPEVTSGAAGTGLRSLAFGEDGGFAVGDKGAIKYLWLGRWMNVPSPTASDLTDVAVRGRDGLAGGAEGTLLELHGGKWSVSDQAGEFAAGQDVTAVGFASDGTRLAATGGNVLVRQGSGDWRAGELPPLGVDVVRLRGYLADGQLHVLALVKMGDGRALLDGDASGWRAVGEQIGAAVSDFDLDPDSGELWITGRNASGPIIARLHAGSDGTWTAERTG
jgi:hypothetical protein